MGTFVNIVLILGGLIATFLMGGLPSLLIALVICAGLIVYNMHQQNMRWQSQFTAWCEQQKRDSGNRP